MLHFPDVRSVEELFSLALHRLAQTTQPEYGPPKAGRLEINLWQPSDGVSSNDDKAG